ncbi:MAG: hypothetical protein ABEK10_03620 [Candidatus Nanosalina sp.]
MAEHQIAYMPATDTSLAVTECEKGEDNSVILLTGVASDSSLSEI